MSAARESQAALRAVTGAAVADAQSLLRASSGGFEARRAGLLEAVPALVGYYSEGSAALAADFYEAERSMSRARSRFTAELVIVDRTVRIRRGVAWAAEPLAEGLEDVAGSRLAEVVQLNTARPHRDTVTEAVRKDPDAAGWRRVAASDACRFCLMLSDRGAVYKADTVRFAAHDNCHCTANPVWSTDDTVTASALQYAANGGRVRTPEQKATLRDYLAVHFPDARG